MRKIILPVLLALAGHAYGQSVISSVNSGALSNNNLSYSVGEIYVNPVSWPDEANSGLMAVLSRVEFFVGVDEKIVSDDMRVAPNPVSSSLFFQTGSGKPVEHVFIYDANGRLVFSKPVAGNKADLSGLSNGVYFIHTNMDNIPSLKIIKQ